MLDILVKNGIVIDGTGEPAFRADVGVVKDRIALVAKNIEQQATRTIDARGLHVAPGFIDPHAHSDLSLLVDPRAESKVRQGVTTEIVGNCGFSPAPLLNAAIDEMQTKTRSLGLDLTWKSMGEYLDRLRTPGTALNVVALIGHNTVRGSVLGYDDIQPEPAQQARMEQVVAEAMTQGARGLSTGLYYPPGYYAHTKEVIGLARVVARYGGIYATHIRNESDRLLEAVTEAIEIGQHAGVQVEIAHLKLLGYRNWTGIDRLVSMLESAQAHGVRLGCDQYPYPAGSSWLASILPYWAQAGGSRTVAERLRDPATRAQLEKDWKANRNEWEDRSGIRDWTDVIICNCQGRPEVLGKNIAEIAGSEGKAPLETVVDLIVTSGGSVSCVWFDQSEDNVRALMRHPMVAVGSDGSSLSPHGVLGRSRPHPRSYGTFPRVLGRYVREEKVLSLEEAVTKMTQLTAQRFGLSGRGTVQEGNWADLVLFDAQTVADKATFAQPHCYPVGIPYVIVNGSIVIDRGQHTGELAGQVL